VAEPTDLQTIIAARGDSYLEITVTGRAAHSGKPSDGLNAIYGAATVVSELERWHGELSARRHPLVGAPTWSVGQIAGGTGTSTVPAECLITADRRLLPDETGGVVLADTAARIEALRLGERGLGVAVDLTMQMPGFETAPDHPLVVLAEQAVRDAGGPDLPLAGWTAACDGGFIARDAGVPVIVLGPGSVAEQAHRADESVGLDELLAAARTYALCAMRLLAG
jgi:acetylornithine deacetylase